MTEQPNRPVIADLHASVDQSIERNRNADGTVNGVAVMSEVTGLPMGTLSGLWAEIQANHARLKACEYHYFEAIDPSDIKTKYRCARCLGEVDHNAFHWHEQGRSKRPE